MTDTAPGFGLSNQKDGDVTYQTEDKRDPDGPRESEDPSRHLKHELPNGNLRGNVK